MSFQYVVPVKERSMWFWVASTRHPIILDWSRKLIIFLYVILGCKTFSCNAVFSYGHLITRKILTDHKSTRAQVIFICHTVWHSTLLLLPRGKKSITKFDSRYILIYLLVSYGNKCIVLILYYASLSDLPVLWEQLWILTMYKKCRILCLKVQMRSLRWYCYIFPAPEW